MKKIKPLKRRGFRAWLRRVFKVHSPHDEWWDIYGGIDEMHEHGAEGVRKAALSGLGISDEQQKLYNRTVRRLARAGIKEPSAQIIALAEEIEHYRARIDWLEREWSKNA